MSPSPQRIPQAFVRSIIAALLLGPIPCAALMDGLSTPALVQGSDLIVQGTVEKLDSHWSDDKELIFTRATIAVARVLRGSCRGEKVTVEYPGGRIGDIGLGVSDQPQLAQGEHVVLFLAAGSSLVRRSAGPAYHVYGAAQGKYAIGKDGIARKGGFAVLRDKSAPLPIENNIALDLLIESIQKCP